jgi:hypothetical protein
MRNPALISIQNSSFKLHQPRWGQYFVQAYLDDLLGLFETRAHAILFVTCTLELLGQLSLFYQVQKCELIPSTKLVYLGFLLDIPNKLFLLSPK